MGSNMKSKQQKIINHKCTCGKVYGLLSSLHNHIRTKHDGTKTYHIKERSRGRPAKETENQKITKEGFVPIVISGAFILTNLLNRFQKITNFSNKQLDDLLRSKQEEIKLIKSKLNEDNKNWLVQSMGLFRKSFNFIIQQLSGQLLQNFIYVLYEYCLIKNINCKDQIIQYFNNYLNLLPQQIEAIDSSEQEKIELLTNKQLS